MTRQEYLVLRLALKKGFLEPAALSTALAGEADKPVINRLVKGGHLAQGQVRKCSRLASKKLDQPEPDNVKRRKDELYRRYLIEGQECPLGAISAALTEQKRANGSDSIGEILFEQGKLRRDRFEAIRGQVDDHYYRAALHKLAGNAQESVVRKLPSLNDFEIIEEIARGGMGIIYRARQKGLDRIVALKLLDPERVSRTKVERFRREAKLLSRLRHPNIVSILQVGEEDGSHFFSMELIEGQTLEHVLDTGDLPLDRRLDLVAQVAGGMAYAHKKSILHRDIKPANIILDGEVPKIADFGLSRNLREDTSLTRDGAILGTPYYMSPEQIRGNRNEIGAHTDQFAIGVLLYEAVTGELPFHGTSTVEVYHKIMHEEPIPLERQVEGAPDGLGLVCRKAMSKDPADRYGSVAELAADLQALRSGEPISLRPPGPLARLARSARRHRLRVAAACLVGLGAATLLIWLDVIGGGTERPPTPVAESPQDPDPQQPPAPDPDAIARKERQAELERLEAQAEHAMTEGNMAVALEVAGKLDRLVPKTALPHMIRAKVAQRQNDHQRVLDTTEEALRRDAKRVRAYELRGGAFAQLGDRVKALDMYDKGLELDPRHRAMLYRRASLLLKMKRPEDSLADLTRILDIEPSDLEALWLRAFIHLDSDVISRAIEDYSRYIALRPQVAQAWYYRAYCYEREGKLRKAKLDYEQSLLAGLPKKQAAEATRRLDILKQRLGQ